MSRRRLIRLEQIEATRPDPGAERMEDFQLAWAVAMLFRLAPFVRRPGESRDAYEARTFHVTTREWKALCKAAGPDSDLVLCRDAFRKRDEKPGDREHERAVLDEMMERILGELGRD